VRLSATPAQIKNPSPLLGQHTYQVLREVLGMTPEEIAALEKTGVIAGQKQGS
jgi:crotonobetainyl-CoA:carnitine CoA-transferase CaiB-like acyl-CoA transferase